MESTPLFATTNLVVEKVVLIALCGSRGIVEEIGGVKIAHMTKRQKILFSEKVYLPLVTGQIQCTLISLYTVKIRGLRFTGSRVHHRPEFRQDRVRDRWTRDKLEDRVQCPETGYEEDQARVYSTPK
ncbi:PREDICTED: uncharacterized protein LOC109229377 [Nicotiana attenuata]|uniref:uncharacterized protein LOC109229377 n=1 Tax=Nicotiana attenuata TaxID=49451 RepID=UPI000905B579|nr:PREDICTED: uncharacterized protein LOC109229377 [Nicotiana attenuata]